MTNLTNDSGRLVLTQSLVVCAGDTSLNQVGIVFGASLSEPHTKGTALRKCVCIRTCLRPYTDELIQIFHEDRTKN